MKLGTSRNLILAVVLTAALLVVVVGVIVLPGDKAPQTPLSENGTPYLNTDGATEYQLSVTEISQTYFAFAPYELDSSDPSGGWYYVKSNIFLTSPLTISGDVRLIIGDGFTLTVTGAANSITVETGSLSVFAQPKGTMGKVAVTGDCGISLADGSSLVNTASISSTLPGGCGVHAYGTAAITNGVTGIIQGGIQGICLESDSTVNNKGTVITTEAFAYGIDAYAHAVVTNAGKVQSSYTGIALRAGGTIDNSGTVTATEHGIESDGDGVDITNQEKGLIEGESYGIYVGHGGTVNNSGIIRCTDDYCESIYASIETTVINSGTIQGTWSGINLYKGGAVINDGMIYGTTGSGIVAYSDTATVFNTGQIRGEYGGVSLDAGGMIDNFGTVTADAGNAVDAGHGTGSVTLNNFSTIKGSVFLSDAANSVTFTAGSRIEGDFHIGASTGSVLTFAGTLGPSLQYSVVTGTADIGDAEIQIDGTGLPSTLTGGDTVVLIDASAGSVTDPVTTSIIVGVYDFILSVEDDRLVAKGPVLVKTPR